MTRKAEQGAVLALAVAVLPAVIAAVVEVYNSSTTQAETVDCAAQIEKYTDKQVEHPAVDYSLPETSEIEIQCSINKMLNDLQFEARFQEERSG